MFDTIEMASVRNFGHLPNSPSYFNNLPPELINIMAQFLDQCSWLNLRLVNNKCHNTIQIKHKPCGYDFSHSDKTKIIDKHVAGHILAFAQHDPGLVFGHNDGKLYTYDINNKFKTIYEDTSQKFTALTLFSADSLLVGLGTGGFFTYGLNDKTKINFSRPGPEIISIAATSGGYIAVLDANGQGEIHTNPAIRSAVIKLTRCNSIIAHENNFVYHIDNEPIRMWDCVSEKIMAISLPILSDEKILCLASLDKYHVACGSSNGKIYIWNTCTGNITSSFKRSNFGITSIVAFPDYSAMVCLDKTGVIKILDYQSPREIQTLEPEQNMIPELISAMPDGRFAVTKDGLFYVYNLPHLQTRSNWCTIL